MNVNSNQALAHEKHGTALASAPLAPAREPQYLASVQHFAGIGKALRLLRKSDAKRGRSQQALADVAGLNVTTVTRAENDDRPPDLTTVDAILTALDKTPHDLARALDEVNGRAPHTAIGGDQNRRLALAERPTARGVREAFPSAPDDLIQSYLRVWNEAQGVTSVLEDLEEQLVLSQEKTAE